MKILLTGHRGFIGSHLALQLESQHELSVFEWGDALPDVRGLDWVVHVGAISSTTERDVEKIMLQNVDFSAWIFEQCAINGVNFQFSSSASVYGLGQDFRESAPVDPRTPYAWSKYFVERHVLNRSRNIRVQCFRYFNVYGSGEEHKGSQASPHTQFGLQAQRDGCIRVFENSERFSRDFIPVEQVVDYHQRFFDVAESGVFNIGTGVAQSFRSVADQFSVPVHEIPMPPELHHSYQTHTCADMTRTRDTLARWQKN